MDDATKKELQSAVFERLIHHLRERTDVQNIDLMNLAGFCRNCLSKWYREEAQKKGIESVILTDKQNISLLSENRIYSITLPNLELNDTTGIGDIFCAAFGCTMLKEKDILWALSFGGGAAQAALESRQIGLEKIPSKGAIESNAYYFYNTVKFKEI